MNYSWNWSILIQQPYLGWLVSGLELTLVISISAWALALIAGTLVGVIVLWAWWEVGVEAHDWNRCAS